MIAMCCGTNKVVCLNSATACMEMILRVLGVGPDDEVITSAYNVYGYSKRDVPRRGEGGNG